MAIKRVILESAPGAGELEYKTQAFVFNGSTFDMYIGDSNNDPVKFTVDAGTVDIIGHANITDGDSPYTVVLNDTTVVVLATASGGDITINLPSATEAEDHIVIIKRLDSTGNDVTISLDGADNIDGSNDDILLTKQYDSLSLFSNGGNWFIIAEYS